MESKTQRDLAEAQLIDLIRRHDHQNFRLAVLCDQGRWSVSLSVPETEVKGEMPYIGWVVGTGANFTEAWTRKETQQPFQR